MPDFSSIAGDFLRSVPNFCLKGEKAAAQVSRTETKQGCRLLKPSIRLVLPTEKYTFAYEGELYPYGTMHPTPFPAADSCALSRKKPSLYFSTCHKRPFPTLHSADSRPADAGARNINSTPSTTTATSPATTSFPTWWKCNLRIRAKAISATTIISTSKKETWWPWKPRPDTTSVPLPSPDRSYRCK